MTVPLNAHRKWIRLRKEFLKHGREVHKISYKGSVVSMKTL